MKHGQGGEVSPPHDFPNVTPSPSSMPAYSNQMLFDIHQSNGKLEVRVEHLCKQHDDLSATIDKSMEKQTQSLTASIERLEKALDGRLTGVETRLTDIEKKAGFIAGFLAAAIVLIPVCGVVIWWALGEKVESLLLEKPAQSTATPAPKPKP
ncbi:hypothetical protein [Agrobacterium sp. P15N1-A]|uniref:hypothetical protein n=1 Tax=Agrobacterium sp. P15N1-A TaxID=3342820 RepID=UPI0037D642ED